MAKVEKELRLTGNVSKVKIRTEPGKTRLTLIKWSVHKSNGGLGDEKIRWQKAVVLLNNDITNLVGNIDAAGAVAYLGPFTAPFRNALIEEWVTTTRTLDVPVDNDFKLQRILADPVKFVNGP